MMRVASVDTRNGTITVETGLDGDRVRWVCELERPDDARLIRRMDRVMLVDGRYVVDIRRKQAGLASRALAWLELWGMST